MKNVHKLVIAAALLLALGLGALTGLGGGTPMANVTGPVLVAHADDGCDTFPPPGGLDCPDPPTPTPTPHTGD